MRVKDFWCDKAPAYVGDVLKTSEGDCVASAVVTTVDLVNLEGETGPGKIR